MTRVPVGTYVLHVRRIGYTSFTSRSVAIAADQTTTFDVPIEPSPSPLDQIVVRGTTLTGAVSHRATWREVDFSAFFAALFGGTYTGSERDYWITYPAYTKFNVGVTQQFYAGLSGFLQVDNAGNSYRFERVNLITPMGRVTTIGLKWRTP
jgi:hypothetical protein